MSSPAQCFTPHRCRALQQPSFRSSFTFTNDLRCSCGRTTASPPSPPRSARSERRFHLRDGDDYTVSRRVQFIMQHFRFTAKSSRLVDAAPVLAIEAPDNGIQNEPVGATEWSVVYGPGTDLARSDPDGDGIPQSPPISALRVTPSSENREPARVGPAHHNMADLHLCLTVEKNPDAPGAHTVRQTDRGDRRIVAWVLPQPPAGGGRARTRKTGGCGVAVSFGSACIAYRRRSRAEAPRLRVLRGNLCAGGRGAGGGSSRSSKRSAGGRFERLLFGGERRGEGIFTGFRLAHTQGFRFGFFFNDGGRADHLRYADMNGVDLIDAKLVFKGIAHLALGFGFDFPQRGDGAHVQGEGETTSLRPCRRLQPTHSTPLMSPTTCTMSIFTVAGAISTRPPFDLKGSIPRRARR